MSAYLKVQNLYYKDILKDIDLELEQSIICALMGKNGSGKTLLLKSIFGLVDTVGLISIKDVIISEETAKTIKNKLGIFLGIDNLENGNVFSNILEPLKNLEYDEIKAKNKVYEISKKLDIENLLYKEIDQLSYTEKKVVSFAISVVHEPKILLLDNIFDCLDSNYKSKVVSYLNYLKKSKKSIIIFTTNDSDDLKYTENLLIMKNGKIIVNDKIDNLIQNESKFTKTDIKLPFLIDLSYKLKSYGLIDQIINGYEEMVDEVWQ